MSPINCLIVEDEPLAQELLADHIKNIPFLNLVGVVSNVFEAQKVREAHKTDLVFLDINLPMVSGIAWLKSMDNRNPNVILTTANPNFAIESYELNVIDYLLKPIRFERFLKAINRYNTRIGDANSSGVPSASSEPTEPDKAIYVEDGKSFIRLALDEIQFIEGQDDYVRITTQTQKLLSTSRLNVLEKKLPSPPFFRLNRSIIISEAFIDRIYKHRIKLINGSEISVTPAYEANYQKLVDYTQRK